MQRGIRQFVIYEKIQIKMLDRKWICSYQMKKISMKRRKWQNIWLARLCPKSGKSIFCYLFSILFHQPSLASSIHVSSNQRNWTSFLASQLNPCNYLANWRHFVTIMAQSLSKLHCWQLWHSWRCFLSIIFSIVPHEQVKPMAIFLKSNLIQEKLSSGFQIKVKVKVNQAPAL